MTIAEGWPRYLAHAARPGVLDGASPKTVRRYRAVRDKHVKHCAGHGLPRPPARRAVFRGRKGGKLDPDKVLKVLKRDVIGPLKERFPTPPGEVGLGHGGVHGFRHDFVTEVFLGGATDGEVRDWVGHRDSRIVERYRHLRGRAAKQTMARLTSSVAMGGRPNTRRRESSRRPGASTTRTGRRAAPVRNRMASPTARTVRTQSAAYPVRGVRRGRIIPVFVPVDGA